MRAPYWLCTRWMTLLAGLVATATLAAMATMPGSAVGTSRQTSVDEDSPRLSNLSRPRYESSVVREYWIRTRYGTIYGHVERPVVPAGVKVPTILTYSPYAVLQSQVPGEVTDNVDEFYVPRGYARAYFHLVGTGNSGGCYDYGGIRERRTAARVVEFLAHRTWSNQKVGMIGASYNGTTQWAAAVQTPPHLTTIVPQVAISRWYDYAYGQGVRFASGSGTPLLFDVGFNQVPIPTTDPLNPANADALIDSLRPCETIQHQARGFGPDPTYDGFWAQRDYRRIAERIDTSVLLEGSWTDYNVHPINSIAMWHRIARDLPSKLRMGQQGHGTADFNHGARIRHAWFDHWLLGRRTGVMGLPKVDSLTNTGVDLSSNRWPPEGTQQKALELTAKPAAGALALTPGDSPTWTDADPQLSESVVLADGAPLTSVLFRGRPATQRLRIAGVPVLSALTNTDQESTHLTPVLFDEAPNGARTIVSRGLLNSRNRASLQRSDPLAPGEAWRGRVRFQPVDYILRPGHRLGLAVMSMNSDEALYPDETRAANTLLLGGRSLLRLPVR